MPVFAVHPLSRERYHAIGAQHLQVTARCHTYHTSHDRVDTVTDTSGLKSKHSTVRAYCTSTFGQNFTVTSVTRVHYWLGLDNAPI